MASEKIIKAINIGSEGVQVFAPESGPEPHPVYIHPDEDGVLWYWTPEPPEDSAE